jgi:hypothetical protein
MFWKESTGFQVADPSDFTVNPRGWLLGLVRILVSLLVSEIDAQLLVNDNQLSLFAFLMAFW